jgi:hypothetical protein
MEDIWRAESEDDAVQERLNPGGCFSVHQWDDDHIARDGVNEGQGLGLSRESLALALEVHAPLRARGV